MQNDSQKDWGTVYASVLIFRDKNVKVKVLNPFLPLFPTGNKNLSIGMVLYENDRFFNSKIFNSELDTKRRVVAASLTDKSFLDNVEFAIWPKVSDCKLIMIT